jgi:ACS family tartrate transporter-like MFS transporter
VDEGRTRKLIGLRLLPFLFVLYIVNYIDRTNLAYAALRMTHDLGFSDRVIGLGAGIFFLTYVALQVPGARMVDRFGARRVIFASMTSWGALTVLMAMVQTPLQLYGARLLLGAAEASFFPGVIVYLSKWFIREDRGKATSNFMSAIPVSSMLGSPLAGWLLGHSWSGMEGWRWLFVVEGVPAVVLGIAAYLYLTDKPSQAQWLAPEQRQWIEEKLHQEHPVKAATITLAQGLANPLIRRMSAMTFLNYIAQYCFVFWFPTMLKRISGLSDAHVGFIGAIPFLTTFVFMQILGWHSDREGERHWHAALPLFLTALGAFGLLILPRSTPFAVSAFVLMGLASAYLPVFWTIPSEILTRAEAPTAVGIINSVGSAAGFAGPYAFGYLYTVTGSFVAGLTMVLLCAAIGGALILSLPRRSAEAA